MTARASLARSALRNSPAAKRAVRGARGARNTRNAVNAESLYEFEMVTGAAISPDENRIAYTVESVAKDHKRYFNHLHVYDRRAGSSKQYTFGETADRGMIWSPDGKSIA
ncbi:MAG: hypothetical protein ACE5GA_04715, partial [Candidatus Zixiibacteriota bacterium]